MIRRLLYHSFWNFYDYLGTYLLVGFLSTLAIVLWVLGAGQLAAMLPPTVGIVLIAVAAAGLLLMLPAILGGFFAFATRAAKDEAARLPHFRAGARELYRSYLKVLLGAALASAIILSNIWFYSRLASGPVSSGVQFALAAGSMLFVWVAVALALYLHCLFAVPARFPQEGTLRSVLRRGAILFASAPGLWITVALLNAAVGALCALSVAGVIFWLPIAAVLTTTAMEIVVRFLDDLVAARQDLGEGHSLGRYKRRAAERGWEWEYRQPRRGLRDLIRPWES